MLKDYLGYLPMVYTIGAMFMAILIGRTYFGLEARYVHGFSYRGEHHKRDNAAVTVRLAGFLAGLMIAVFGAYRPATGTFADFGEVAYVLVFALAALVISRYVNDFLILYNIDNTEEVVKQKNVSVAIVETSTFIATALIFVGGISDPTVGFFTHLVWFCIGQAILIGLAALYRLFAYISVGDVLDEIEMDNHACALSLAGFVLSGGIAVGAAISGTFESWFADLGRLAIALSIWLCVAVVAMFSVRFIIVPGSRLVTADEGKTNWSFGFIEALVMVILTSAFVLLHA